MSCSALTSALPKSKGLRVNGISIPRDRVAQEVQHHPSKTPTEAWMAAARALVIRELLLQEAKRLDVIAVPMTDSDGRRETAEEASIRSLIAQEVQTPQTDEAVCRRYYDNNRSHFRSPDIFEVAHILISASGSDAGHYGQARAAGESLITILRDHPERFAELAIAHSACPSVGQGGNLGQLTEDQVTPEFAQAMTKLAPGEITKEPVATRYGFHVIRLGRRIEGRELPFDLVRERIADYLKESVERRAASQYIARLASQAHIDGISLTGADAMRVH